MDIDGGLLDLWNRLDFEMRVLIENLGDKLSLSERQDVLDYIDHNEFGVALHALCSILKDNPAHVEGSQLGDIERIAKLMGFGPTFEPDVMTYVLKAEGRVVKQ